MHASTIQKPQPLLPWRRLLAGGTGDILKLSFQKSEREFVYANRDVQRRWDVDSFIARATTLAVHRGGFSLSFKPRFLSTINQNPRVLIQGHQIHKLKQIRLGHGLFSAGFGYNCHIFFPHMKKAEETHLSDETQAIWIDRIVIPALKRVCPTDVLHHFPLSYAHADGKANVKREAFITSTGIAMDVRYTIAETYLNEFWLAIVQEANSFTGEGKVEADAFSNPFLVVSGHGLKLATKQDTLADTCQSFHAHLEQCFRTDARQFAWEDCWLDLGMEDVPHNNNDGITLLRKAHCLDDWAEQLSCPNSNTHRSNVERYPWTSTRDAGSISVELTKTNSLRLLGGIAYSKAYNVHKEVFATPLKDYGPFQNTHFEALGYSSDFLEKWYRINSKFQPEHAKHKRAQLLAAYDATKHRMSTSLEASKNESYGVRQEHRITWEHFNAIERMHQLGELPAGNLRGDQYSHAPYWILPTRQVNAFVAAELSRWLHCLEAVITTADATMNGSVATPQDEQLVNGVMVSALVRMLCVSSGAGPMFYPALWRKGKKRRPERVRGDDCDSVSESSEYSDGSECSDGSEGRSSTSGQSRSSGELYERIGLDIQTCVSEYGLAWFPRDMIEWDSVIPIFKPELIGRLALAKNAFQKSFPKAKMIRHKIVDESVTLGTIRRLVQSDASVDLGTQAAAELVVQSYVQEVITIMAQRWNNTKIISETKKRPTISKTKLAEYVSWAGLTEDEASGLRGLSREMAERLGRTSLRLVESRPYTDGTGARNGVPFFARYDTGLWADKLHALFAWGDEGTNIKRGWDSLNFRQLTRQLHTVIIEERGALQAEAFMDAVHTVAARVLWVIPQYNAGKLSVMYDPKPGHSKATRAKINDMNVFERTNWIAAQVDKEYIASILEFQDYLDDTGYDTDDDTDDDIDDDIDDDTDDELYGRQDGQALGHRDGSGAQHARGPFGFGYARRTLARLPGGRVEVKRLIGQKVARLKKRVEEAISPLNLRVHYDKKKPIYLPEDPGRINVRLYLDKAAQIQEETAQVQEET